ncbi:MAG: response regulator [Flavobacteriales bacterium]|nr:response regulator [Flavobacteriales bacterium]
MEADNMSLVRALIIEDDVVTSELIKKMLNNSNHPKFAADTALSFEEAKRSLSHQSYDIVLLDLNLPDSPSTETMKNMAQINRKAAVIVVSSINDKDTATAALKQGAQDYIIKGEFEEKGLISAIHYAIERQRLRDQLERLSLIASKTDNAIFTLDRSGKITWVNEGFTRMTGYTYDEIRGTRGELLRKEAPEWIIRKEILEKCIKDRKSETYEIENYTKSGRRYWTSTTITPTYDAYTQEFKQFVVVDADITDRILYDIELMKAKVAEQNFLANMTHEIRTPLNAITGFTELLLNENLNEKQRDYLRKIKISSDILTSVIGDILDFSKIRRGLITFNKERFNLKLLLEESISIHEFNANKKGIQLTLEIDPKIPSALTGDTIRLKQILLNLIGNAVKFTSEGYVSLNVVLKGKTSEKVDLLFTISDTGIGIAEDDIPKIFQQFKQAKDSTAIKYGGTGLGLSIVKKLIEFQGGTIDVRSKEHVGTTFTVTMRFDIADGFDQKQNEMSTFIKKRMEDLSILLVEDNEMNQAYMTELFDSWNVKIDCASNGRIAIDKITEKVYDLVLMDVQMPEMNGYQVTEQIRKSSTQSQNVPILAMTASASSEERKKCFDVGMNDFLSKPVKPKDLKAKISTLVLD